MKRITSCLAIVALVATQASPCWSQGAVQSRSAATNAEAAGNGLTCVEQGRLEGARHSSGGAFTVGLVSGVIGGLLGTGVAYALQREPDAPENLVRPMTDSGCRVEFRSAYAKTARAKKRMAVLGGGLLGTGIAAGLIVAASSN